MIVSVHDWKFDVDVAMNMQITSKQASEHCMCGYCRNYYRGIDAVCPTLRTFLMKFGIHVEGPDELSPFEPTIFEASYIVNGSISQASSSHFYIDNVPVMVLSSEDADMDTVRPKPYFVLVIGLIEIPWLLDEDPREVISPANEDAYLRRMECKLLNRIHENSIYS